MKEAFVPCRKHGSALDARRLGLKCLFSPMPPFSATLLLSLAPSIHLANSFSDSFEIFVSRRNKEDPVRKIQG